MIYLVLKQRDQEELRHYDNEYQTYFTSDPHTCKQTLDAFPGRVTVYNLANLQEIKDFEISYTEIVEETQDEAVPTSM